MDWDHIAGHGELKKTLQTSISQNRVSHAQLFLGKAGYGTLPLALAFAQEIFLRENAASASKVSTFNHLDLHFAFPVFKDKKRFLCQHFMEEFRQMISENPYASAEDWQQMLLSENKQLNIYSEEIDEINKRFSLKSFEGGSKVLIMWQADKMNTSAANKFLKFLEEPPKNTLIILLAESADKMLPTILSRTQLVDVPPLSDGDLHLHLTTHHGTEAATANDIIFRAQGDYGLARQLASAESFSDFDAFFIQWVREAFQVKKKPEMLRHIVRWGHEVASWSREKQKSFLAFCAEMFRLAMLQNYGSAALVYKKIDAGGFKWDAFSNFIHGANIEQILEEISQADYHLERNASARIVWTDLGIKLSRYLHRKS